MHYTVFYNIINNYLKFRWGYTGEDYATKLGVQIATVKAMIDYVTQTY